MASTIPVATCGIGITAAVRGGRLPSRTSASYGPGGDCCRAREAPKKIKQRMWGGWGAGHMGVRLL